MNIKYKRNNKKKLNPTTPLTKKQLTKKPTDPPSPRKKI